jgi:DNA-binding XRE family transcriptional regulator
LDTKKVKQERRSRAKEWKEFRASNLLTQTQLADLLDIHRRTVQDIEAEQTTPYFSTLRKFEAVKAKYSKGKNAARKSSQSAALGI